MIRRLLVWAAAFGLAAGCTHPEDGPFLIEGTTYRIGRPVQREEATLNADVYTSRLQCESDPLAIPPEDVDLCVPHVDRATGEIRLAFALKDTRTGDLRERPVEPEDVKATYDGQGARVQEVIPHNPRRVSQLFIVVLDGSSSMWAGDEGERVIDRVYRALTRRSVQDAFFPEDAPPGVETGVVLLRFNNELKGLDGGPPRVITSRAEYLDVVRRNVYARSGGFTWLYKAVGESLGPVLESDSVDRWLTINKGEPTIIAISDGFNNEQGSDRCGDNAERLSELLDQIRAVQAGDGPARNASLYTVGLGRPVFRDFDIEKLRGVRPTPDALCGNQAGRTINGDLETYGIDNASLAWIAMVGKGESFVAQDDSRLAQVFVDAAAERYRWYEVRYRVDPWFHRRAFTAGVLIPGEGAGASVPILPSGWIDAPTASPEPGTPWTRPTPMRATLGLVMPILGALVLIHFLGPASFNGRRAVTRRARRRAPRR